MATKPRKISIDYQHTVERTHSGWFWVSGPNLTAPILCEHTEDAEAIAAALNFAGNYDAIQRRAQRLADELEAFKEYK